MNRFPIFQIIKPTAPQVPLLISIPHCGTIIPEDIIADYDSKLINPIDDTDYYVDRLYSFAGELGITIIKAHYSRWVIDLNRNPENNNLYDDGRIITSLCPTSNFLGDPIYRSTENEPDATEIDRRLQTYFLPYYQKIETYLNDLKAQFGMAILWDGHSIRREVPTIHSEAFPDMILGTNDSTSANQSLIDLTLKNLTTKGTSLNHNIPFKGGNITRHFGRPSDNLHALQLEMSKDCYMDDEECNYDPKRAQQVQKILKKTFTSIIDTLA